MADLLVKHSVHFTHLSTVVTRFPCGSFRAPYHNHSGIVDSLKLKTLSSNKSFHRFVHGRGKRKMNSVGSVAEEKAVGMETRNRPFSPPTPEESWPAWPVIEKKGGGGVAGNIITEGSSVSIKIVRCCIIG